MKTRLLAVFTLIVATASLVPTAGYAAPQDSKPDPKAPAAATQDVVYMADGRVLHGQIISQTKDAVVFEYHDRKINIKTKLTLKRHEILKIEEDVALEGAPAEGEADAEAPKLPEAPKADKKSKEEYAQSYGASRVFENRADVPSFYIVPMKGQMGTDVQADVYKKVAEDIKKVKPSVVVILMNCADTEDVLFNTKEQTEAGLADLDDFRDLVNIFQDDLREFKQICWIEDSEGMSSVIALAWPDLYMKPNARLGGLLSALQQTGFEGWADEDVRGKMTAAFMSWIKAFLEAGGYALELADAMVRPRFNLSASWQGRDVKWSTDLEGEYVVDQSDKRTTEFRAKDAEDLLVSDGTAETLDDLALLMGYREYRLSDGIGENHVEDYIKAWRHALDECERLLLEFQDSLQFASGEDEARYVGKAKTALEKVLAYVEKYRAVEIRLASDFGWNKLQLKANIEALKERLKAIRERERNRGGGGGGSGRMGRGGGGVQTP